MFSASSWSLCGGVLAHCCVLTPEVLVLALPGAKGGRAKAAE